MSSLDDVNKTWKMQYADAGHEATTKVRFASSPSFVPYKPNPRVLTAVDDALDMFDDDTVRKWIIKKANLIIQAAQTPDTVLDAFDERARAWILRETVKLIAQN